MSEIVAIKTGKAPVEYVTAKLTVSEVQHIVATYKKRDGVGYVPSWIRSLERAANGETNTIGEAAARYSFADAVMAATPRVF